jgi:hypothetical protein
MFSQWTGSTLTLLVCVVFWLGCSTKHSDSSAGSAVEKPGVGNSNAAPLSVPPEAVARPIVRRRSVLAEPVAPMAKAGEGTKGAGKPKAITKRGSSRPMGEFGAGDYIVKPLPESSPEADDENAIRAGRPGHIWIRGHWRWSGKVVRYAWVKGRWEPVKLGHRWVPGRYQWKILEPYKVRVWILGKWERA